MKLWTFFLFYMDFSKIMGDAFRLEKSLERHPRDPATLHPWSTASADSAKALMLMAQCTATHTHTVGQKGDTIAPVHIFAIYWPILEVVSLAHSALNLHIPLCTSQMHRYTALWNICVRCLCAAARRCCKIHCSRQRTDVWHTYTDSIMTETRHENRLDDIKSMLIRQLAASVVCKKRRLVTIILWIFHGVYIAVSIVGGVA